MKQIIRKIIGVLITPEIVFYALKRLSKKSNNKIDDSILLLVKSAYYDEPANMKQAVLKIIKSLDD